MKFSIDRFASCAVLVFHESQYIIRFHCFHIEYTVVRPVRNVIRLKLSDLLLRQYLDTTFQWLRSNGNEAKMGICIFFCLDHERRQKLK